MIDAQLPIGTTQAMRMLSGSSACATEAPKPKTAATAIPMMVAENRIPLPPRFWSPPGGDRLLLAIAEAEAAFLSTTTVEREPGQVLLICALTRAIVPAASRITFASL